ncbi:hypothetical protein [uncultured Secundilactobacillus sp.]|uniref:hypothetical protein n=1 Tax=uncultured Secundilactobacillus sp. TaxID=2813935 RepID=UPI002585BAA9|nr:hypothetical protein [uncultured Secundilactobacillus sp.]
MGKETSRLSYFYKIVEKINDCASESEQNALISEFDAFLLSEMYKKRCANVAQSFISVGKTLLDSGVKNFLNQKNLASVEDFENLNIFKFRPGLTLQEISSSTEVDGDEIKKVHLVYARKIITTNNLKNQDWDIEYNWVDIDLNLKTVTFFLPSESANHNDEKFPSRPKFITEEIKNILSENYGIGLSNEKYSTDLYKIYHRLTTQNEKSMQEV